MENLTKESVKSSKSIFDFCDIKWDSNSLEFYKRKDLKSKTASTIQIRNKIYSYDTNKFRSYEFLSLKYLKDFVWLKNYL